MGTVDENDQGPWVWSGDAQIYGHAYVISREGVTYLQSPITDDLALVQGAINASRQGQVAWLAYYAAEWSAMHTWLQARTSTQRTRLYQLCRAVDAIAAGL
jgi:hypothetical protein